MSVHDLRNLFKRTNFVDVSSYYQDFVPFTANSVYPVHRWYRYKEGYSRDLVHLIIGTLGGIRNCLDPFGGSGTTALSCQEVGIPCDSVEVNPFVHHVAVTKLTTSYAVNQYDQALAKVKKLTDTIQRIDIPDPVMMTLTERPDLDKWLFSRSVLDGILLLRQAFAPIAPVYRKLFITILASILPDVGNTTKDGKCVRYKPHWQEIRLSANDVVTKFFERASEYRNDIEYIQANNKLSNARRCHYGSALSRVHALPPESIHAVITSPPYLNSFDYTDVYMPELWALGFVNTYADVRALRERTLKSHVQVKWQNGNTHLPRSLVRLINEILDGAETLWNTTIPEMIAGYFIDMQALLSDMHSALTPDGTVCIVVGNSSYYGVVVPTDILLADLAEELGFKFDEMRILRQLKRSTQQSIVDGVSVPPLRESLLILKKKKRRSKATVDR